MPSVVQPTDGIDAFVPVHAGLYGHLDPLVHNQYQEYHQQGYTAPRPKVLHSVCSKQTQATGEEDVSKQKIYHHALMSS